MKFFTKALAATCLVLGSMGVHAQELKIGYVNLDKVLRDASPAKAAQAKLEQEFSRREKDLGELEQRLKNSSDKFEKDALTLGETERNRRQRDLVEQDRELQRKRREFQEDLNQRKNEELSSVLDRANRVVKQIFEQEKYDIIFQEAVFAAPRIDITEKVIRALNSGTVK